LEVSEAHTEDAGEGEEAEGVGEAWVWRGGISGNSMLKSGVFNQGTQFESRSMATLSCLPALVLWMQDGEPSL
jgi:hypothetical protein